jgi:hypothetical protein
MGATRQQITLGLLQDNGTIAGDSTGGCRLSAGATVDFVEADADRVAWPPRPWTVKQARCGGLEVGQASLARCLFEKTPSVQASSVRMGWLRQHDELLVEMSEVETCWPSMHAKGRRQSPTAKEGISTCTQCLLPLRHVRCSKDSRPSPSPA